jgi:sortase (surface protein transpeptidase)
VRPDDQLLLLVTCVENDTERRVVAARRVREGEDEAQLKTLEERSWKKP